MYEIEIMAPETEIMKDSVDKELLEIVGIGNPMGSVPKETIAVSVTMLINVQK